MKYVLVALIMSLSTMILLAFYARSKIPEISLPEPQVEIEKPAVPAPEPLLNPLPGLNVKSEGVKSLRCDDLEILLWQNGHRFRLFGSIVYQKPNLFRLIMSSRMGKEAEIGSNNEMFWYWSRRDKHPGLYFAAHSDFNKTRLKTPFNPNFLKASLGLEQLGSPAKSLDGSKDVVLEYHQTNSLGEPVIESVFVSRERQQIDGILLANPKGKPLAACQVKRRDGLLPLEIVYLWYEEGSAMQINFKGPQVNVEIEAEQWQMPDLQPRINMAEQ